MLLIATSTIVPNLCLCTVDGNNMVSGKILAWIYLDFVIPICSVMSGFVSDTVHCCRQKSTEYHTDNL